MLEDAVRSEKWKWVNEVIRELREPIAKQHAMMQNGLCITMNKRSLKMMGEVIGIEPSDIDKPHLYGIPIRINDDLSVGQVYLIHEFPVFEYNPTKEERYVFDEE